MPKLINKHVLDLLTDQGGIYSAGEHSRTQDTVLNHLLDSVRCYAHQGKYSIKSDNKNILVNIYLNSKP